MGKFFLASILLCSGIANSFGQKLGHLNYRMLIDSLPESKAINDQLDRYEQSLTKVGNEMVQKFQDNYRKYQESDAGGHLTANQQKQMQSDLEAEQTAIGNYQNSAKESFQKRQSELLKPLLSRIDTAIRSFALKESYQMIFDSASGLIISPPGDDVFAKIYMILTKK